MSKRPRRKAVSTGFHHNGSPSALQALRNSRHNPGRRGPAVVSRTFRAIGAADYDVCVAGGTLGIFLALALQVRIGPRLPYRVICTAC